MLSFDEWNVWYQSRTAAEGPPPDWPFAPRLLEDTYDVADAVVVGSLLISLLRHCDRVTAACQAQLVNVIAPIVTEPGGPAWRQTIFYPFAQAARLARGSVLRVEPVSPRYATALYGDVKVVDAVATYDQETGEHAILAVNRDQTDPVLLTVNLPAATSPLGVLECSTLTHTDRRATNSAGNPRQVEPRDNPRVRLADRTVQVELPPISWNTLTVAPVQHIQGQGAA